MDDSADASVGSVSEETILEVCGDREPPRMGVIEQVWETEPIARAAIAARAAAAVDELDFEGVPAGGEVAIGAGSRGIANLDEIVRGVVAGVRDRGYQPFVFPAMGSHGGATAAGQVETLESLGVDESIVDCEIRATMDVVEIGETPERGVSVYADANAVAADAIVPVNRIKPHTDFSGDVESGLSKMLVIGMGKQRGAKTAHEWAIDWSFRNMIPEIASLLLAELPVAGGVAVVEDQYHDTAVVEGVPPSGFLDREAELLETAYELLPTLPFDELDALVIDRLGKDISGQGMDTNVVGRQPFAITEPEPERPDVKRIYARSLTETTRGNAMGVGSADVVHRDVVSAIDPTKSLINAITASTIRGVRLPPVVETDRAGLTAALSTVGVADAPRVLRVTDTMHLDRIYASAALIEAARDRPDLTVVRDPEPVEFASGAFAAPTPADPE